MAWEIHFYPPYKSEDPGIGAELDQENGEDG